ncbi:chromosomal replication initiator protein DnaA [Clostridia bacterium]|nr:chromosomal replication initiator protein DnaA [Clostridia bacterium]
MDTMSNDYFDTNDFVKTWAKMLKLLPERGNTSISTVSFESIIEPLEPLYARDGFFVLQAPDTWIREIALSRYGRQIEDLLNEFTGLSYKLNILAGDQAAEIPAETAHNAKNTVLTENGGLNSKYVFETFVKGKSNELAYTAAVAVAERPGATPYNPLFLYGGVGLGKTHLMHSIGNAVLRRDRDKKVMYTTTENFTNEFVTSLMKNNNQGFRNKFREIDVFLIDDIQFLSDKEGIQEELFHTFNTLYNSNKQIVISSDQPPKELRAIEDRLTSRFGNGLIIDITLPDFETRTAILRKKAEQEGIVVTDEVTLYIAKSIVSNIRELEGALTKVIAFARLGNASINLTLAEKVISDFLLNKEKKEVTIDLVIEVVANYFELTVEDIKGKKRTQNIVYPRQIAMYLSRKLASSQSLPLIGRSFGGKDHSTVIHSCDKVSGELERDIKLKSTLIDLENEIMLRCQI